MRVIAGQWRGRLLRAPRGDATRPTADRTRETLFNMLASRLGSFEELCVADLFAGSGALGLEALSRGAAHCLFVDEDRAATDCIRANAAALGCTDRMAVQQQSATRLAPASTPFDLLLLDPPYGSGAGQVAVHRLLRLGWLAPHSIVALETGTTEQVEIEGLAILVQRRSGKALLTLLQPATD